MVNAEVLSIEEANSLGLSSIVHAGQVDEDNPVVDILTKGIPRADRDGRPIISYKQYQELATQDVRLDPYAMLMTWPGSGKANTIQASKFHKWWGLGYRPISMIIADSRKKARQSMMISGDDETVLYRCRDKYPDCRRFFDNPKGLKFHWRKDHGEEASFKKPKEDVY